jgi:hypothetical protein
MALPAGTNMIFDAARSGVSGDVSTCGSDFRLDIGWTSFETRTGAISGGAWSQGGLANTPINVSTGSPLGWAATCRDALGNTINVPPFSAHFVFDIPLPTRPTQSFS